MCTLGDTDLPRKEEGTLVKDESEVLRRVCRRLTS